MTSFETPLTWISTFNDLGKQAQPFLFLIDFEMQKVWHSTQPSDDNVFFNFNGVGNIPRASPRKITEEVVFKKYPLSYLDYLGQFMTVQQQLKYGNSFLINLTHRTPIYTNLSLLDIFHHTDSKYRMYFNDEFVFFSPETFVKIRGNTISTFPMKGTIDANIPNAHDVLMNDVKEICEHTTTVDLLRNDLSKVAKRVTVDRFRYIEQINTNQKNILQVSSEINGVMSKHWQQNLGSILNSLLPAGSICGAPKDKTRAIIANVEEIPRGYYTGICGYFDGQNLDTGVCIRYVEQDELGDLQFRSGCGITHLSKPQEEYQEMIDKIYLPLLN